ncbi:MAG: hypothetical protein AABX98_04905 [Nanoarchaeota archaeon]
MKTEALFVTCAEKLFLSHDQKKSLQKPKNSLSLFVFASFQMEEKNDMITREGGCHLKAKH